MNEETYGVIIFVSLFVSVFVASAVALGTYLVGIVVPFEIIVAIFFVVMCPLLVGLAVREAVMDGRNRD